MSSIELLSLQEAAKEMGVSYVKLRELVATGEVKTIPWGRQVRIPRRELDRWINKALEAQAVNLEAVLA